MKFSFFAVLVHAKIELQNYFNEIRSGLLWEMRWMKIKFHGKVTCQKLKFYFRRCILMLKHKHTQCLESSSKLEPFQSFANEKKI